MQTLLKSLELKRKVVNQNMVLFMAVIQKVVSKMLLYGMFIYGKEITQEYQMVYLGLNQDILIRHGVNTHDYCRLQWYSISKYQN